VERRIQGEAGGKEVLVEGESRGDEERRSRRKWQWMEEL